MVEVNDQLRIPLAEIEWSFARAGGPGGQNVNKVASKAILRWNLWKSPSVQPALMQRLHGKLANKLTEEGDLLVVGQRFRDQPKNKEDCLAKLADMLRRALTVEKPRVATKPSKGAKRRRLNDKKQNAVKKQGRSQKDFDD